MSGPEDRRDVTPQLAERALMAGIDRDLDAHPGTQRDAVREPAEGKANRYPLHDLDPVAGGILRRQQGEYRTARRGERRDLGGDGRVRIGVDGDARRITFLHIGEVGLPDVGLDVEIVGRHQWKGGLAGIEKGSNRNALDTIGNAVKRREDGGEPQIARRSLRSLHPKIPFPATEFGMATGQPAWGFSRVSFRPFGPR